MANHKVPDLRIIAAKLSGPADLIERYRTDDLPLNQDEIQYGIGLILAGLAAEVRSAAVLLEEGEMARSNLKRTQ